MSVKGNEQLTVEVNLMATRMQELANQLDTVMGEVGDKITKNEETTKHIQKQLEDLVNPLLQADLINHHKTVSDKTDLMSGMIAEMNTTLSQHKLIMDDSKNKFEAFDLMRNAVMEMQSTTNKLQAEAIRVGNESGGIKTESDKRFAELQQQMVTMSQTTFSTGTSPGSRSAEPFITHKLIMGKDKITGDEEFTTIDEWIKELQTDLEIILPGSKAIMLEAERRKTVLDDAEMMRQSNSQMVMKLSREIFVIISKKTVPNSKARFELNGLDGNQGLEALRRIRLNLCKREGPRLQDEYEAGTTLPKIKESDMSGLQTLLRRWESEIEKFQALDQGYALGVFQRRNMVYRALPESCQREVDNEVGKGELSSYESFMDFVINMSRHARYKKQSAPKPLSANLISEEPGNHGVPSSEPIYSMEEWSEWMQTQEGQSALHNGYEPPQVPEVQQALLAVAKGKGKGQGQWNNKGGGKGQGGDKGKGKGKGQGQWNNKGSGKGKGGYPPRPFTGKCHNCDEIGHYARDCPHARRQGLNLVDDGSNYSQWQPGPSAVTLCITESIFTGYRTNSISNLIKPKFSPTTLSTNFPISMVADNFDMDEHKNESQVAANSSPKLSTWQNHDMQKDSASQTDGMQLSKVDFPVLQKPKSRVKSHKNLTRLPKNVSQRVRFTCDADSMTSRKFEHIVKMNVKLPKSRIMDHSENSLSEECDKIIDTPECDKNIDIPIPVPDISHERPKRRQADKKTNLGTSKNFSNGMSANNVCRDMCGCANNEQDDKHIEPPAAPEPNVMSIHDRNQKEAFENDPSGRPPPIHWKTELDNAIKIEEARHTQSLLPGCGPDCGFGVHSLRSCKANFNKSKNGMSESVGRSISFSSRAPDFLHSGINLLTDIPTSSTEVNAVDQKLVWAQIPCAVDSGACAHVTPANIFAILGKVEGLKPKFYAADGSPIENMGECTINAVLEDGTEFNTNFDVAKITRPLLSVHQMVQNGHQVIFGKNQSYLQLKGGKRVPLRQEGKLYMLDVWSQIPEELAKTSPFVRQVAHP